MKFVKVQMHFITINAQSNVQKQISNINRKKIRFWELVGYHQSLFYVIESPPSWLLGFKLSVDLKRDQIQSQQILEEWVGNEQISLQYVHST